MDYFCLPPVLPMRVDEKRVVMAPWFPTTVQRHDFSSIQSAMRQTNPSGELKKENRRHISEVLLAERLGLDDEWVDPDNIRQLPTKLPPGGWRKRTSTESFDLNGYIEQLVKAGCHRQVLYWCLQQMSRAANKVRMGAVRKAVLTEGEVDHDLITVEQPLATGDDMQDLTNKVQAATEMISRYENELLMAAEVLLDNPQLRKGMTEFEEVTPDEAMLMLRSLLHWIKRLADAWPAPNLNTLMKSKGVLFLLAYVRLCERRSTPRPRSRKTKETAGPTKPDRLALKNASTVADIAQLYTGEEFTPSNLIDKLQDFRLKHPNPHGRMVSLLKSLEEVARSRPSR
jgi:hypothetical protein